MSWHFAWFTVTGASGSDSAFFQRSSISSAVLQPIPRK